MEPAVILSDELILEIISWLPVKSLMKFMCVSKFFKTLISDPYFVQMHLNKSSRNLHLALILQRDKFIDRDLNLVTVSIPRLHQNQQLTTFDDDPHYGLKENLCGWRVVGSCNGLLCLINTSYQHQSFYFWNPAARTKSENFRICYNYGSYSNKDFSPILSTFNFSFGYDNSTRTYKVVVFYVEMKRSCNPKSVVKVFNLGDNVWREIQRFPVLPLYWFRRGKNEGVYLSGTINWIALRDYFDIDYDFGSDGTITVEQYVIVSLDLSTESYTEMLLPNGFVEVPSFQPTVAVLINFLCFCYDSERSYFVIWQMKDFGVRESWIQLFKISYQNFCLSRSNFLSKFPPLDLELLPLYLSENGDTLILARSGNCPAYIYTCIDDSLKRIRIIDNICRSSAVNYIESLVPTS